MTRPQPQADKLASYLSGYGAEAVALPMVDIQQFHNAGQLPDSFPLKDISRFHKIIAISITAAQAALELLPDQAGSAIWFTPGKSTADVLAHRGIPANSPDSGFTSEALLNMAPLQNITGERILLLKGEGGRDLLQQELAGRGAEVMALELYRRACPEYPPGTLSDTVASHDINAIVATSAQIVAHLQKGFAADGAANRIYGIPLLVPSPRVAEQAEQAGFRTVITCSGASNQHIVAALEKLDAKRH